MRVWIALLRGVNVGGHRKVKMEELRALLESRGYTGARTYVQSGNVVFRSSQRSEDRLRKDLETAIEERFGFPVAVVLRTLDEMKAVLARDPFPGMEPNKVLVNFLAADPGDEARTRVTALPMDPEVLLAEGRELFFYFPLGMGKSRLSWPAVDKAVRVTGTGRNWNTVRQLVAMGDELR